MSLAIGRPPMENVEIPPREIIAPHFDLCRGFPGDSLERCPSKHRKEALWTVLLTGIVGNAVATKLVKIGHPHFNLRLALRIALRKAWAGVDSNH